MRRICSAILTLLVASTWAQDPPPPCVSGPVPHTLSFTATALTELDEFTLDPDPEMFLHVFVDEIFVCDVDGGGGYSFDGECTFDIDEPYDRVRIRLVLWDSDEPIDDYTVDIGPGDGSEDLHLEFDYDPQCGTVTQVNTGDIPGCFTGTNQASCRGPRTIEGSEGRITFEIVPADGIPLAPDSLSVTNMETIQVVPNPSTIVADRQTVVRLDIGSSYTTQKTANVVVQALDRDDNLYTHVREVTVEPCSVNREELFFGPEWQAPGGEAGFRPQLGIGNNFLIGAEVDPTIDCDFSDPQNECPFSCEVIDGSEIEGELALRAGKELDILYQPWLARSRPICNTTIEETLPAGLAAATTPLLEDLYPASAIDARPDSLRMNWPLPVGEPLLDIADQIDPRPGLVLLELAGAVAGVDRWVLTTYEGGLACNWTAMDINGAPGASAGESSRAIVTEARSGSDDLIETAVHEIGHTWGLAESPCPITGNLFGAVLCEDEYNYPPDTILPVSRGVESAGFQVLRWAPGEDSGVRDMDGRGCIMGASSPGAPNAWIDRHDYERVLENVTSNLPSGPALFLRTRLTPDGGGSFQRRDVSRLDAVPEHPRDAVTGRLESAHTTTLRLRRVDGSLIQTVSRTLENVDSDMDGKNDAFALAHGDGTVPHLDAAWIIELPSDAETIDLVRRVPTGETTFTETVVDTLTLSSPPFTLYLLAPHTAFEAIAGEWYRFEWEFEFLGGRASRGAEPAPKSYLFMTENDGADWTPIAAYLDGEAFDWQAPKDGRFGVRVFATSGFETQDIVVQPDLDRDGCSDQLDPDPDTPDFDGNDLDGVAQVCDLCPDVYDPLQGDRDRDLVGDACDICPSVFDPQQADGDQDGRGDACDCDPDNGGVFAAPGVPLQLTLQHDVQNAATVADWDDFAPDAGVDTVYDFLFGDLILLSAGIWNAGCLREDLLAPTLQIPLFEPAPGEAHFFLVRSQNACGTSSWNGTGSDTAELRDQFFGGACN